MFDFFATHEFSRALQELEIMAQELVKEKLRYLEKMENPLPLAKRLKGYKDIFRFRAGNYRMVFRLEKQKIILLTVKDRRDIYEGL